MRPWCVFLPSRSELAEVAWDLEALTGWFWHIDSLLFLYYCVRAHPSDNSRTAIYQAGVLEYMPAVLRNSDPEVIKKAAWALTNLSRNRMKLTTTSM